MSMISEYVACVVLLEIRTDALSDNNNKVKDHFKSLFLQWSTFAIITNYIEKIVGPIIYIDCYVDYLTIH